MLYFIYIPVLPITGLFYTIIGSHTNKVLCVFLENLFRMRPGIPKLLILISGLLFYILDLSSDIYVAVQHYGTDQWWFGFTVTFIILPACVVNIAAYLQTWNLSSDESDPPHESVRWKAARLSTFGFCSTITIRYIKQFMQWKSQYWDNSPCEQNCRSTNCARCKIYLDQKKKSAESAYKLAWLCHIETVTESAPQWCLQVYIMLRQWYFPWYIWLSIGISLFCLAQSIIVLEIARQKKNEDRNFEITHTVVFFIWQLFALFSRLSAIVFCAYVIRRYVFIFVILHWLLAPLYYDLWFGDGFKWSDLIMCLLLNCPLFFNVSRCLLRHSQNWKSYMVKMSASVALQNLLMLIIPITICTRSEPGLPHMDEIIPIAIFCVVGGLLIALLFGILYIKLLHLGRIEPTNDSPQPEPISVEPTNDSPQPEPIRVAPTNDSPQPEPIRVAPTNDSPQPEPIRVAPTNDSPQPEPIRVEPTNDSPQPEPITIRVAPLAEIRDV